MKILAVFFSFFLNSLIYAQKPGIIFELSDSVSVRTRFGVEKLEKALSENGYTFAHSKQYTKHTGRGISLIVCEANEAYLKRFSKKTGIDIQTPTIKESFTIRSSKSAIIIAGADATGTLYGCLELAERVKEKKSIPENIDFTDYPEMIMRGTCIGLQKTTYLPGRDVYEYPYTPENFPWFYDKELWIKYLDMMVESRLNSLYLWNGHPFASLVLLDDYPYAVEVDDNTFRKNEEIFSFLTEEANKRGIWVIQMFYNILVSKPFAEYNKIKTQDRSRPIIPIISDYTRKSISAFVVKYPNVGLMVCLGEAMNTEEDDVKWFTETIIPGVKDGLKVLGKADEPPIILRSHDTNGQLVMKAALPLYKNLYTETKYTGESLTTYEPRGPWSKTHRELSQLGSVHINNVHILANLEPFRYGSPDFIQKTVKAMHTVHGAKGLHLYPQASYWDWPYSADNTSPRLIQIDRDWLWYQTWARYAWNCNRNRNEEIVYQSKLLSNFYGCTAEQGKYILEAYEQAGEIAPKLIRRFGITDGNRQTLTLGMFMSQLVNPHKWRVYSSFYESNGPQGEILIEYAEKKWKNTPHVGETPPQIADEVAMHGIKAVAAIEQVSPFITKNKEEFLRLKNDFYCYQALANYFREKVLSAMWVLQYKYSKNVLDLDSAERYLAKSITYYKKLVELTSESYLYANSMQTQQRRIPIGGDDGKNKTWKELLPYYEEELAKFRKNIQLLKSSSMLEAARIEPFAAANIKILDSDCSLHPFEKLQKVYADHDAVITEFTGELKNLSFVRLNSEKQIEEGTRVHFKNEKPVKVLVGYFNGHSRRLLAPPSLETDAKANDRGQADIKIANAIAIPGLYPVNIYTYSFEAGENVIELGKGMALILGFIDDSQKITIRDAGIGISSENAGIDWLFY
jgi:hypothetical protein